MGKVRDSFTDPDYSEFTKECVRVGEALEALGYELENEHYSQGEQTFHFCQQQSTVSVYISEKG